MDITDNIDINSSYSNNYQPDIIIKGGTLITMVDGEAPFSNASVLVKKDRILDITTSGNYPYPEKTEVINAENCVIMPGLVNAHSHAAMTIFRGYADDLPLKKWLQERIFPAEASYLNPENVYWGSMLACLEMIASGTTSFIDGYFFQDETVKATHISGMRALIAQGLIDYPAPGVPDPNKNMIMGKDFIDRWFNYSELITPGLFCHSPVTCSAENLRSAMDLSMDYSLPLQIHLSETREEMNEVIKKTGKRPARYLRDLGLLQDNLIAAHSIYLDDDELELLLLGNVRVVHVPESNMKLSSGVARISEMIRMGIRVGIGTDGCASNNNLDLFKEMDTAAKLGKVFTHNPVNMNAGTVLRMATSDGARIMGLEDEIGTIEKGKKADIIVVDMNTPHLVPLYNPLSSIVYSACGSDVKDVIVNGRILMKGKRFQTLNPEEIMERVRAIGLKIKD